MTGNNMAGMNPTGAQTDQQDTPSDDHELVEADVLVEEISIDGMCGVY